LKTSITMRRGFHDLIS